MQKTNSIRLIIDRYVSRLRKTSREFMTKQCQGWSLWSGGLWSFFLVGTKLAWVYQKDECASRKLLYFLNSYTPWCWSALDFWKIEFEKSSWNLEFRTWFLQLQNRPKIKFIQLDFSTENSVVSTNLLMNSSKFFIPQIKKSPTHLTIQWSLRETANGPLVVNQCSNFSHKKKKVVLQYLLHLNASIDKN